MLNIKINLLRFGVTVDEMKKHFKVKRDKDLSPILNVSTSTISIWRNKGINMLWQQAIQLQSNNELLAREEDVTVQSDYT